jgi:tetratricopeptide (TPR) repeat protein
MKHSFLVLALLIVPAVAQQPRQNFVLNVGTPEGQLLQQIGQELDDAKKDMLMQDFLEKYPKHEGAAWVCTMLAVDYNQQKEYDKALDITEKVYGSVPDMDVAYAGLKAAEGKEDVALVKKWAGRTSAASRKAVATAKPPANDEDKQQATYTKDVDVYSEYALYVLALKVKEPKESVDLIDALEHQNPKSQYLSMAAPNYVEALEKAGEGAKACPAAARMAGADAKNAEAMLYSAQCSWTGNRADGVVNYATKAVTALNSRTKPEGTSDSDWANKKANMLGSANFYIGQGYTMQGRYGPANKALRASLGSIKGNEAFYAIALFDLGLSNYNLGKSVGDKSQMREGLKFFEQSAAMKSSVQDQAARNASLVRNELGGK